MTEPTFPTAQERDLRAFWSHVALTAVGRGGYSFEMAAYVADRLTEELAKRDRNRFWDHTNKGV
jgi:hypothetical protein